MEIGKIEYVCIMRQIIVVVFFATTFLVIYLVWGARPRETKRKREHDDGGRYRLEGRSCRNLQESRRVVGSGESAVQVRAE